MRRSISLFEFFEFYPQVREISRTYKIRREYHKYKYNRDDMLKCLTFMADVNDFWTS